MWYQVSILEKNIENLVNENSYILNSNYRFSMDSTTIGVKFLAKLVTTMKPELTLPINSLLHYLEGSGQEQIINSKHFNVISKNLLSGACYKYIIDNFSESDIDVIKSSIESQDGIIYLRSPEKDYYKFVLPPMTKQTYIWDTGYYDLSLGSYNMTRGSLTNPLQVTVGGFTCEVWYNNNYQIMLKMQDEYNWDMDPKYKTIAINLSVLVSNPTLLNKLSQIVKKYVNKINDELGYIEGNIPYLDFKDNLLAIRDEFWNVWSNKHYKPKPYLNKSEGVIGTTNANEVSLIVLNHLYHGVNNYEHIRTSLPSAEFINNLSKNDNFKIDLSTHQVHLKIPEQLWNASEKEKIKYIYKEINRRVAIPGWLVPLIETLPVGIQNNIFNNSGS